MSIVKLPVTNGPMTLVDNDIAELIQGRRLFHTNSDRYVAIFENRKTIPLHRFIMKPPKGMCVDNINGDRYDNRRINLRSCTTSENQLNRTKPPRAKSGYRLVHSYSKSRVFRLVLKKNQKYLHFCTFRSRHVGGIFADHVLVQNVGPFVKRNFPEKITSSELVDFLNETKGRIFRVVFSRRSDGRQREMVCRTGVNSKHSNETIPFDPSSMNLFSVYDVQKCAYRFIPLENVICIRFAKKNYRVVA